MGSPLPLWGPARSSSNGLVGSFAVPSAAPTAVGLDVARRAAVPARDCGGRARLPGLSSAAWWFVRSSSGCSSSSHVAARSPADPARPTAARTRRAPASSTRRATTSRARATPTAPASSMATRARRRAAARTPRSTAPRSRVMKPIFRRPTAASRARARRSSSRARAARARRAPPRRAFRAATAASATERGDRWSIDETTSDRRRPSRASSVAGRPRACTCETRASIGACSRRRRTRPDVARPRPFARARRPFASMRASRPSRAPLSP